jgi:hypothetical protein
MAYRDSTTASGNGGTPAVSVPSGVASGDIVVLLLTNDFNNYVFGGGWPAGFTNIDNQSTSAPDGQSFGYAWKRTAAADAGSYTLVNAVPGGDWILQAIAFSGRHATDPPVGGTTNVSTTGASSPITVNANGVTALAGDDLLWLSAPDVTSADLGNGHTAPSGYTEAEDAEAAWCNASFAYVANVSAGATGTVAGTFALSSGTAGYVAALLRIPAAAGGGGATTLRRSRMTMMGVH